MASPHPVVSIGVPVYNTERFIAGALDSLLAQTFADFELIISDNASTDGTREICESYAARDSRIRYIRQSENIGLPRNWNAVVHAASGEFFKWASASDCCAPTMVERCVAALRADDSAVLCYGKTQMMDWLKDMQDPREIICNFETGKCQECVSNSDCVAISGGEGVCENTVCVQNDSN